MEDKMNYLRKFSLFFSLSSIIFLSGCASQYSFREVDAGYTYKKFSLNVLNSDQLRPSTMQGLRLLHLDEEYTVDPEAVIGKLIENFDKSKNPETVLMICELSYVNGKNLEKKDPRKAAGFYLMAASHAYDFIAGRLSENEIRYTPDSAFIIGIYNIAVSRGIELWRANSQPWTKIFELDIYNAHYSLTVQSEGKYLWNPDFFDEFISSYRTETSGFVNYYRSRGLGASFIGIHKNPLDAPDREILYPRKLSLPVTAIVEFDQPEKPKNPGDRNATLRFYNPLATENIMIAGRPFPLDADYTAAATVLLADIDPSRFELQSFLNPGKVLKGMGIFLLEPYDPDKIPVLLTHGLYATPATFLEMYNDLIGVPEIRKNYQFWFSFYPTGLPISDTSAMVRKKLVEIHRRFDPESKNANFNNMVVVGHSMGGIISKMLIQESGNDLWNAFANVPIDEVQDITEKENTFAKEKFFFEPQPYIRRAVFIATPHQGSEMATSWLGRLGMKVMTIPSFLVDDTSQFVFKHKSILKLPPSELTDVIPSSIKQLSSTNPFLVAEKKLPISREVPYHSIIGIRDATQGPGSSDGVVIYDSSHLDGAVSEYLVHATHSCVANPYTISEVKRILLLHLQEINEKKVQLKEEAIDRGFSFLKFSKVMSDLSKNQDFVDALMNRIGRNPNAGGILGPEEIQLLKSLIFRKDFAALDQFPGFTVKGMGVAVTLAGAEAKKRAAKNLEPAKPVVVEVLKENLIEELGLPVLQKENTPALASMLRDLGFGLQVGDKIDPSKTKIVADSSRMASMLNRLSLNPTDKDKPRYMVKIGDKTIDSPGALVDDLMKSGCKIEVRDVRYFANFGDLFYKGMEVLTAYWLNTQIPVPGTQDTLLVPVSHSQHELHIAGTDFSIELSFYFGIDGKVEFRVIDTLDQSWVLGRVAKVYVDKDAVEVVRMGGEIIKTYERIKKDNPDLPFGGYYALGVCDDVNAVIEYQLKGETTLFPLPHDNKYFQGDSEVEKIIKKLPTDGRDNSLPDPKRVLGSIPAEDFSKIPMPGLRAQLKAVKAAWDNRKLPAPWK